MLLWQQLKEGNFLKSCLPVKLKILLFRLVLEMLRTPSNHLCPTPPPAFSHLYSLLVCCICKAHSCALKRYPAWMHYWETVGEQLLILESDKESRAVCKLKKKKKNEAGESWSIQTRKVTSCQRRARPAPDCSQLFLYLLTLMTLGNCHGEAYQKKPQVR